MKFIGRFGKKKVKHLLAKHYIQGFITYCFSENLSFESHSKTVEVIKFLTFHSLLGHCTNILSET